MAGAGSSPPTSVRSTQTTRPVREKPGIGAEDVDADSRTSNYSARLEEILDGHDDDDDRDENHVVHRNGHMLDDGDEDEDDDDEGFLYRGADAPQVIGYDAQLKDVLGSEAGDSEKGHPPTLPRLRTNLDEEKQVLDQLGRSPSPGSSDVFDYSKLRVS